MNAERPEQIRSLFVVHINEPSGALVDVMRRFIDYQKRMLAVRRKLVSALAYPVFLVLALIGAVAGFRRRGLAGANTSFVRFLAIYALLLAGFYSPLPYKTPWCLLNFWHPIVLLAGVGAAAVVRHSVCPRQGFLRLPQCSRRHFTWPSRAGN